MPSSNFSEDEEEQGWNDQEHAGLEDDTINDTPSDEEKKWSAITHVSTLCGFIVPFGNIIAPFIIYLLKKDELPLVKDQTKEAMNFQICITIYTIISAVLILLIIGIPLLIAVVLFDVVMTIIAAIKTSEGKTYRYPLTIRFIS